MLMSLRSEARLSVTGCGTGLSVQMCLFTGSSREVSGADRPIPLPIWEDLWRCYAVSYLGGPSPAERVLGIPANTLRQWINDRESR